MLGWFTITATQLPPMSLILSYWMIGAFFMASKRFAEYRQINDKSVAAAYRKSLATTMIIVSWSACSFMPAARR